LSMPTVRNITGGGEMREILLLLIMVITLVSCEREIDFSNNLKKYVCSKEQMAKVQEESLWCSKNTNYLSTYCYATAMKRNCIKEVVK
jgi:hypothetical protein